MVTTSPFSGSQAQHKSEMSVCVAPIGAYFGLLAYLQQAIYLPVDFFEYSTDPSVEVKIEEQDVKVEAPISEELQIKLETSSSVRGKTSKRRKEEKPRRSARTKR